AEFTITRGNNVLAQEDADGNNGTGFSPDGGATLDFDLPLNLSQAPAGYQSAALINLFYWNNLIHDYAYLYGFDEVSGNFQQNNYGNGGAGADYVLADGQDGSGTNNANFSTPADGTRPRMQMFLWTGATNVFFTVNSPVAVAGSYTAVEAGFGPGLSTTPITADLVLANDGPGSLGCTAPVNAAAINGKIALVDRGTCAFVNKVQNMQNAGAIACVVCNNVAGAAPFAMSGATGGITIPSVMISLENCNLLKAQLAAGVNVSLSNSGPAFAKDGDFDNGIIAHEYGHGISNRLTGGPANVNCLTNAEQMGEGWSDYFGLMMTMKASDLSTTSRGIGTYVVSQPVTGVGIRPAPYTTNMAVNDFTYGDITNTTAISQPHGIGFLWCNMLWEMTWNLIADFGFDADLMNGTGGNNIAMQLVMEGMRLQPCNPGFINGRDAILDADTALFGGVHSCQIWSAFAKRGLGLSASQGSANSRSDGAEAFDVPPAACSTLPVEWLGVSATAQEDAIRVAWEVAGEIQNQGFYVERKEERGPFQTLGFVEGKGQSAQSSTYFFVDQQVTPGITYTYRLRLMDLDGGISYSPMAEARIAPRLGLEMALYPNPVSDVLYIELRDQPGSPVEVQIADVVGRHVQAAQFPAEERQLHIDMSGLGAGVYLLRLSTAGRQAYVRVVVE
ncbi:MAG: T9SS C-terminal target domain-containing protein, partial [Bacteroidetes bacterium]